MVMSYEGHLSLTLEVRGGRKRGQKGLGTCRL